MMDHEDDDEDLGDDVPQYEVDPDTLLLIETACNCIATLAQAQLDPDQTLALTHIADALAERFGVHSLEVEEQIHTNDEGEQEVILAPKGGVFPDEPEEEGEAPAVKPE